MFCRGAPRRVGLPFPTAVVRYPIPVSRLLLQNPPAPLATQAERGVGGYPASMCGRFTLKTPVADIAELFEVDRILELDLEPRFNIAPTDPVAVVRRGRDGARELMAMRWGLIPGWAEDPQKIPLMINARAESLDRKPAFREAIGARRCLVIADGFYEWRAEGGVKQPYYVRLRGAEPFAFAGLWDRWRPRRQTEAEVAAAPAIESATIVTTDSNELLAPLHDRMPAILTADAEQTWLDLSVVEYSELAPSLRPYASSALEVFPVGRQVNHVANDDPSCVEPSGPPVERAEAWPDAAREEKPDEGQLELL